ncbi:MAG: hypothetical protein WBP42_14215 [Candidatus Zixiibacteriota bacterium]
MMRWLPVVILTLAVFSCAVRKPVVHDPVIARYQFNNRSEIIAAVSKVLAERKIPIARRDLQRGIIVTDSFEVIPEQCDCGVNFFGAEYLGTRRGRMDIVVSGESEIDIEFKFGTLLTIKANNQQVKCTSSGILEEEILKQLEKSLGVARENAQN